MAVATITGTGLNLATAANNFTISIINYTGGTTQYATNISRTTLISGYNVTINPGDITIRATSTGVCGSSADVDVSTLALQSYGPSEIDPSTFGGSPDSLALNFGGIQYVIGEFTVYSYVDVLDFSVTHISTTGAGGLPATSGPFLPPTLEVINDPNNSTSALIVGDTRNSYSSDPSVNTTIYRVTYTPTGLSRDVNYYWVVDV
jgi:hypothetical protein